MATFNSTQVANIEASPRVFVRPNEHGGRVRVSYFSYTTPASSAPAVGDVVRLARLPKGARVIDFHLVFEAMSSGGGTAGMSLGLSTSGESARYTSATNMDSAGTLRATAVLNKLPDATPVTEEPTYFQGLVTGEALAVSKTIQGVVLYVVD